MLDRLTRNLVSGGLCEAQKSVDECGSTIAPSLQVALRTSGAFLENAS
jgi:hypothetical protein